MRINQNMGNSRVFAVLMVAVVLLGSVLFSVEAAAQDWRNILNGNCMLRFI